MFYWVLTSIEKEGDIGDGCACGGVIEADELTDEFIEGIIACDRAATGVDYALPRSSYVVTRDTDVIIDSPMSIMQFHRVEQRQTPDEFLNSLLTA